MGDVEYSLCIGYGGREPLRCVHAVAPCLRLAAWSSCLQYLANRGVPFELGLVH